MIYWPSTHLEEEGDGHLEHLDGPQLQAGRQAQEGETQQQDIGLGTSRLPKQPVCPPSSPCRTQGKEPVLKLCPTKAHRTKEATRMTVSV